MRYIFRRLYPLHGDRNMLLQAQYCPEKQVIQSIAVHPVVGGIVGPVFMDAADLDVEAIQILHALIFSPYNADDDGKESSER